MLIKLLESKKGLGSSFCLTEMVVLPEMFLGKFSLEVYSMMQLEELTDH